MLLERYKGHLKLYDILDDKRYYKHLAKAYHLKTDLSLKKEVKSELHSCSKIPETIFG